MPNQEWQHCKCGASWLGYWHEACDWCWKRKQAQWVGIKADLLNPPWMHSQGPKYRELSEVDRLVWDTTRGIKRGTDVERQWMADLQECYDLGLLTENEMARAIGKWMNYMKQPSESSGNISNPMA